MTGVLTQRIRDALAGPDRSVGLVSMFAQHDRDAAELATVRMALATAYAHGPYVCGLCDESFEFITDSGIDDYAALNRWLGRHDDCGDPAGLPYALAMSIVNGLRP